MRTSPGNRFTNIWVQQRSSFFLLIHPRRTLKSSNNVIRDVNGTRGTNEIQFKRKWVWLTPHGIAKFVILQTEGNLYPSSHVLDLEDIVPECVP